MNHEFHVRNGDTPNLQYIIRTSDRARHARLKVCAREGLVVVVPRGFNLNKVPEIIDKKRYWIEKASAKVEPERAHLLSAENRALPKLIVLQGIGEHWEVDYIAGESTKVRLKEDGSRKLIINGDIGADETVRLLLVKWLTRKAKKNLAPLLYEIANDLGFNINGIQVRSQKTRWGSCSHKKNISINYKLLFVPEELVDYVFLHELCHTVHMNHSPEFWKLLEGYIPECKVRRKELKAAWQYVPAWLDPVS